MSGLVLGLVLNLEPNLVLVLVLDLVPVAVMGLVMDLVPGLVRGVSFGCSSRSSRGASPESSPRFSPGTFGFSARSSPGVSVGSSAEFSPLDPLSIIIAHHSFQAVHRVVFVTGTETKLNFPHQLSRLRCNSKLFLCMHRFRKTGDLWGGKPRCR